MKKIILTVMTLLIMTCIQGCSYSEFFYREYNHTKMSKEQKIEKLANVMGETYDDKFQFVGFPTWEDYAVYRSEKYPDSYVFANVYDKKDGFGYIYTDNYLFVKEAEELKNEFRKQVEGKILSDYIIVTETEKMLFTGTEGIELPEQYYRKFDTDYYMYILMHGKDCLNDVSQIEEILNGNKFQEKNYKYLIGVAPDYVDDIYEFYTSRKRERNHYSKGCEKYYIDTPDIEDIIVVKILGYPDSDKILEYDYRRAMYFCNPIEGMKTYLGDKYGVEFKYVEDSFVRGETEDKAQFINPQNDVLFTVTVLNVHSFANTDDFYYAYEFSDDYKSILTSQ